MARRPACRAGVAPGGRAAAGHRRRQSLVDFGHGCGVHVVAEGVETAAEAAVLRALDVDYVQGWFFGRPGPPEALTAIAPAIPRPRAAL